jgi:hypothetical protein
VAVRGEAAPRSDCAESRVERRVAGDMGVAGVDGGKLGGLGSSLEKRFVVLTLIPAFLSARMRSAMLPPDATLGPSSWSSLDSSEPFVPFALKTRMR